MRAARRAFIPDANALMSGPATGKLGANGLPTTSTVDDDLGEEVTRKSPAR